MGTEVRPDYVYHGHVVRVIDGDTFEVVIQLGFDLTIQKNIRLKDFDTPETWRPRNEAEKLHGTKATEFVEDLIGGKDITLRSVKFGKYRYVADVFVFVDGVQLNLAEELAKAGLSKKEEY